MAWFEHGTSRIYYEEYGTGDAVLLLPGFVVSTDDMTTVREALAADYRVIVADLPGSGRSLPQPRKYTATFYEDDAHSFTALLEHLNIESAHLIGWSDGGEVVLHLATGAAAIARSVVIWGAAGSIQDPDGKILAMADMIDNPTPELQGFSDYLIESYGKDSARITMQTWAAALTDIVNKGGNISLNKADTITCPVLLLSGDKDEIAPPELISKLATKLPNVEVMTVADGGHSFHEDRPEWFIQTVSDWLKQH
jgi:valacyclovir hydrolase